MVSYRKPLFFKAEGTNHGGPQTHVALEGGRKPEDYIENHQNRERAEVQRWSWGSKEDGRARLGGAKGGSS